MVNDLKKLEHLVLNSSFDEVTCCWDWKKYKNELGYGKVGYGGRVVFTHRLLFSLWHDLPLESLDTIMHICDRPQCINPFHLKNGTQTENSADMVAKGRQAKGKTRSDTNRGNTPITGESKYRGVSWYKRDQKWLARISILKDGKSKQIYLKSFTDEVEAAKAYDQALDKYCPHLSHLRNFPTNEWNYE